MSQNVYALFTDDPVVASLQDLKAKLAITIIADLRQRGLTQAEAAKLLKVSQPRVSNLLNTQLEKFSAETLLGMLVRLGYKMDFNFDPTNRTAPLNMALVG